MFEKEAEEYYYKKVFAETNPKNETELKEKFLQTFKDSAEFGYNKANEWHNLRKNPKDFPKNSDYEKLYLVYWGENNYIQYRFSENDSWKDIPTKNLAMFYYTHHSNMMCGFQYRAVSVNSRPVFKEVRDEYV